MPFLFPQSLQNILLLTFGVTNRLIFCITYKVYFSRFTFLNNLFLINTVILFTLCRNDAFLGEGYQ